MDIVEELFKATDSIASKERYGLIDHMRKTSISIPSNIAEGRSRGSRRDYIRFLRIAYSSGSELETQIEIATRIEDIKNIDFSTVSSLLEEVMKMLNVIIRKLNSKRVPAKANEAKS